MRRRFARHIPKTPHTLASETSQTTERLSHRPLTGADRMPATIGGSHRFPSPSARIASRADRGRRPADGQGQEQEQARTREQRLLSLERELLLQVKDWKVYGAEVVRVGRGKRTPPARLVWHWRNCRCAEHRLSHWALLPVGSASSQTAEAWPETPSIDPRRCRQPRSLQRKASS